MERLLGGAFYQKTMDHAITFIIIFQMQSTSIGISMGVSEGGRRNLLLWIDGKAYVNVTFIMLSINA